MNTPFSKFGALLFLAFSPAPAQCPSCGKAAETPNPPPAAQAKPPARATNTRCPVMGEAVSAKHNPSVRIGERYYMICCPTCAKELADHPERFLDKDGEPLNALAAEDAGSGLASKTIAHRH